MNQTPLSGRRRRATRRGVVTVEFAMTAPVLFLFCLAGIEFSRANMLLHTATIAATEGTRRGIVSGATAQDCYDAAQAELVAIGVDKASILVEPSEITDQTSMITVGVQIPIGLDNGYITPRFILGDSVIKVVSITRELKDTSGSAGRADQLKTKAAMDLAGGGGEAAGKKKEKGGGTKGKKKKSEKGKGKGKGKK